MASLYQVADKLRAALSGFGLKRQIKINGQIKSQIKGEVAEKRDDRSRATASPAAPE